MVCDILGIIKLVLYISVADCNYHKFCGFLDFMSIEIQERLFSFVGRKGKYTFHLEVSGNRESLRDVRARL